MRVVSIALSVALACGVTRTGRASSNDSIAVTAHLESTNASYTCVVVTPPEAVKPHEAGWTDQSTPLTTVVSLHTQIANKDWAAFQSLWWKNEEFYKEIGAPPPSKEKYLAAWASNTNTYFAKYIVHFGEWSIVVLEAKSNEYKSGMERIAYPARKVDQKYVLDNRFTLVAEELNLALGDSTFDPVKGKFAK